MFIRSFNANISIYKNLKKLLEKLEHEYIEWSISMKQFLFLIKEDIYHSGNTRDRKRMPIHKQKPLLISILLLSPVILE